ncbi:protein TMEPAI isoform X2 [Malurus melanocephalus]|uniref:protein TMEPAI isoform X2 n=1 Tax=Malurus melanocephalus TaxID=175006 RepID=UPI0025474CF3|nr:protein TMEPAI isoform X2 [Malurus melanocephalus]
MYNFMGLNSTAVAIQPNVSCTCNCKRSLFQSMEITELEFVQIIIIVVVMMVMVVVITCLLNHYKLSARSFISRHSQGRRRDENLSSEGSLWPSESTVSGTGITEVRVLWVPRPVLLSLCPCFPLSLCPSFPLLLCPFVPLSCCLSVPLSLSCCPLSCSSSPLSLSLSLCP